MTLYTVTEKIAYSTIGKLVATVVRNHYFPDCRVHWVQQALTELSFAGVRRSQARLSK